MDYIGILNKDEPWREQAIQFLLDWLNEIKKYAKNTKVKNRKRGAPFDKTVRKWLKTHPKFEVDNIMVVASQIMARVSVENPKIKDFL